jgi:glutamate racemase
VAKVTRATPAIRGRSTRAAATHADEAAVGVFDSGIGGLTVFRAIANRLPREQLLYLGDTARLPYGSKSPETVTMCAVEVGDFFAERGVKLMVVACNTSSAIALDVLRARYDIPVLGVIAPGARAAVEATTRGRIGVIGTEATIASGAYEREIRALAPTAEIFARACPLFVPLAEEGWLDNDVARRTVALYLSSLKKSGIDSLILGCTHYPLLRRAIADFIGPRVRIVDSAEETALEVRRQLRDQGLLRARGRGTASFFVTDAVQRFLQVGERFYGASLASAVRVVLRGDAARAERLVAGRTRTRA